MSSFGDGNIKTEIDDELKYIFEDNFNHSIYESTHEEQLAFISAVLEVLHYRFCND